MLNADEASKLAYACDHALNSTRPSYADKSLTLKRSRV